MDAIQDMDMIRHRHKEMTVKKPLDMT